MSDIKRLEFERDELTILLKAKQAELNEKRKKTKKQTAIQKRYDDTVKANDKLRAQKQALCVRVYDTLKSEGYRDKEIKIVLGLNESRTLSVVIDEWRRLNKGDL